jgi:hypothetical protein
MESSTPPESSAADDSNAQDPLALPNTNEALGMYGSGGEAALNCNDKESSNSTNVMYQSDSTAIKHEEHEQRLQYDANHQMTSNYDQQKLSQMGMQQSLHEPHKTFSHSIENLSKTTEKCPPNDMKM